MNTTIFLGSDKHLYQLVGTTPTDIGIEIQEWLDSIPVDGLDDVTAFYYNGAYHISYGRDTYVRDTQRKYWTRYDWDMDSYLVSYGGTANESIAYGMDFNRQLYQLYKGEDGDLVWRWESRVFQFQGITSVTGVYVKCRPPYREVTASILVDNEIVENDTFVPNYGNNFRMGAFGRGSDMQVTLSGRGLPPQIQGVEVEYS